MTRCNCGKQMKFTYIRTIGSIETDSLSFRCADGACDVGGGMGNFGVSYPSLNLAGASEIKDRNGLVVALYMEVDVITDGVRN